MTVFNINIVAIYDPMPKLTEVLLFPTLYPLKNIVPYFSFLQQETRPF